MNEYFFNPLLLQNCIDLKVRQQCKYCKRYGKSAQCPPNVESINYYKDLFLSYNYGKLIIESFKIEGDWKEQGRESSKLIQKRLNEMRDCLLSNGVNFYFLAGAGSCKNCETCIIPCRTPDKALIPLEATGVDVVRLVEMVTTKKIKFPIERYNEFMRIGLILWESL